MKIRVKVRYSEEVIRVNPAVFPFPGFLKPLMANLAVLAVLGFPMAFSKPTEADVIAPLSRSSGDVVNVRLYNPSYIAVTGTVNGQNYSLPGKNVQEFTVTGDTVAVVPSTNSENNKLPDPVVDVEQSKNGMISSPVLLSLNVAAAQIIPRVEPDTKIYASNPSSQTITVTASYAPMGQNPQNGARQTVTIEPFETVEVPNALSAEGSAYVASSGAEPVLLASVDRAGSGYNAPALPAEARNNRYPQAFILQTGEEKVVILSGSGTSTNTMTFEARGPEGDGYVSSEPLYGPPNIVTSGNINGMLHQIEPPNSSCTAIPQYSDESKAAFVLVYQNPATLDQRMQPGQEVPETAASARAYVEKYFPSDAVYLDNFETRSAIMGTNGVRSYKSEIAALLLQATPTPPWTQQEMEDQLVTWADCQLQAVTDDFYHGFDPQQITPLGVRFYFEPTGENITDFKMSESVRQQYRSLQKKILTDIVDANKTRYNCSGEDAIDMSCPPTWDSQDPNSGCY